MFWFICQSVTRACLKVLRQTLHHIYKVSNLIQPGGEKKIGEGRKCINTSWALDPTPQLLPSVIFSSGINKITVAIYWMLAMCQHFPSNISLNLLHNNPYRLAALSALSSFSRRKLWLRQVKWCVQDHASLRSLTHCLKKTVHPPHLPFWQWITQSS